MSRERLETEGSEPAMSVVEARTVDQGALHAFFTEAFGVEKADFLSAHGDWWHRGPGNRYVALVGDEVAGFRGIIPAVCLLDGTELPGVWGVDLFVLPRFRGLGLQRLLDQRLADASDLVMSFPGELGAQIYSKQGYGLRQDLPVLRMSLTAKPLVPARPGASGLLRHVVRRFREMGLRESARRLVARSQRAAMRAQTTAYRSNRTEKVDTIDPQMLEALFFKHLAPGVLTTRRDADYLRWRYLEAPYRADLGFYLSHADAAPARCAVVRYLSSTPKQARILDVIGDQDEEEGLADLIRAILRDAMRLGVEEVGIIASSPALLRSLERIGFELHYMKRFRWHSTDSVVHDRLSTVQLRWSLGDSDTDRPQ